jgi:hypothetical protein
MVARASSSAARLGPRAGLALGCCSCGAAEDAAASHPPMTPQRSNAEIDLITWQRNGGSAE